MKGLQWLESRSLVASSRSDTQPGKKLVIHCKSLRISWQITSGDCDPKIQHIRCPLAAAVQPSNKEPGILDAGFCRILFTSGFDHPNSKSQISNLKSQNLKISKSQFEN